MMTVMHRVGVLAAFGFFYVRRTTCNDKGNQHQAGAGIKPGLEFYFYHFVTIFHRELDNC